MSIEYIHSYGELEQIRLLEQAAFLESYIHKNLHFAQGETVLEIGCGVGAQISALLKRHSVSKITGIDISDLQIAKAREVLGKDLITGKVELHIGSGDDLPFDDNSFDSVCIFFVLEHYHNPAAVIDEVRRVLKPNGRFFCTETFNSGFYVCPQDVLLADYWMQFNTLQRSYGGDPDIGIKLPNYMIDAGFCIEDFFPVSTVLDKRMKKEADRIQLLKVWEAAFLSAYGVLEDRGMVPRGTDKLVSDAFVKLSNNTDAVFIYDLRQIIARKRGTVTS